MSNRLENYVAQENCGIVIPGATEEVLDLIEEEADMQQCLCEYADGDDTLRHADTCPHE